MKFTILIYVAAGGQDTLSRCFQAQNEIQPN